MKRSHRRLSRPHSGRRSTRRGRSGSWLISRRPPSPTTPGSLAAARAHCLATEIRLRPFGKVGPRRSGLHGAETGSLSRRLTSEHPRLRRRGRPPPLSPLHRRTAISMVSSFPLTRSTKSSLPHPNEPNRDEPYGLARPGEVNWSPISPATASSSGSRVTAVPPGLGCQDPRPILWVKPVPTLLSFISIRVSADSSPERRSAHAGLPGHRESPTFLIDSRATVAPILWIAGHLGLGSGRTSPG